MKKPTDLFTTLELEDPSHDIFELHATCQIPDFEATKLGKSRSGKISMAVPEMSEYLATSS